jgi:hypothetical protein
MVVTLYKGKMCHVTVVARKHYFRSCGNEEEEKMWASCNVVGSQQPGGSCAVTLHVGPPVGHAWGRDVAV